MIVRSAWNLPRALKEFMAPVGRTIKARWRHPLTEIHFGVSASADCSFGAGVKIFQSAMVAATDIGRYSYVGEGCRIRNSSIGSFTSIGPDVLVAPGVHPTNFVSTYPGFYSTQASGAVSFFAHDDVVEHRRVDIGSDVWIGARAIILDGVRVGNGAIIAAGSIVTRDVAPFTIVGGIPARLIKFRFSPEEIVLLNKICWWNMDVEQIKLLAPTFADLAEFCAVVAEKRYDDE